MVVRINASIPDLIKEMADFIVVQAKESIRIYGAFNMVLSGGSSPELLYKTLSTREYQSQFDWSKVNFFFGDERYVPADDPRNNANMARNNLFIPLNIASRNIYAIDTSLSPDKSAMDYANRIKNHFKGGEVRFDLILLGLGDNAHTASLFPDTDVLLESSVTVRSVFLKDQKVYRITMTAPMINQSHHIAFLVFGSDKSKAVYQILEDKQDLIQYPAQLIKPDKGNVYWFLDEAAAAELNKKYTDLYE